MNRRTRTVLAIIAVLVIVLAAGGVAVAQDATMGHLVVVLRGTTSDWDKNVIADFYIDGALVASQAPSVDQQVAPGVSHKIEARNINCSGVNCFEGWNYKFQDASTNMTVAAGQRRTVALVVKAIYTMGELALVCDVQNWVDQDVKCLADISGSGGYITSLTLGGKDFENEWFDPVTQRWVARWWLDPGQYTVRFYLKGTGIGQWSPEEITRTVRITASKVADPLQPQKPAMASVEFKETSHLIVTLDQPGVVGDFYVDGALIGSQVASIALWATPNKAHKIEVKNLVDPTGALWKNISTTVTARPGDEKSVVLVLKPQ